MRSTFPIIRSKCDLLLWATLWVASGCGEPAPADADTDDLAESTGEVGEGTGELPGGPPELPVYIPATRECRDAIAGEPPGESDAGQVCTWQSVGGATEEGRRFRDYADCDVVRTQRPYYPVPVSESYREHDPRMEDPAYAAELEWVRAQIDATGCSCCHGAAGPQGPVRWSIDLPGHWVGSLADRDVALLADWIDTSMFERYPADENNGFARPNGVPSTDPERLTAFFEAEALSRGLSRDDFADAPPTGGILLEQAAYVPPRCSDGEGVDAEGIVRWTGGDARYIYVLDDGSDNPTVPPDRDTPMGTRWRLDVPPAGQPMASGSVVYGELAPTTTQHFPTSGAPTPLIEGHDYYLYVTRDMYQPITRCSFSYPSD